jgi:hypothetical protein
MSNDDGKAGSEIAAPDPEVADAAEQADNHSQFLASRNHAFLARLGQLVTGGLLRLVLFCIGHRLDQRKDEFECSAHQTHGDRSGKPDGKCPSDKRDDGLDLQT